MELDLLLLKIITGVVMTLFQKKIWICLMGFSVLNIFNVNHSLASEKYTSVKKIQIASCKN